MAIIPGKTYAELAATDTLSTRFDSHSRSKEKEVFVGTTQPQDMPEDSIWIETDNEGNVVTTWTKDDLK